MTASQPSPRRTVLREVIRRRKWLAVVLFVGILVTAISVVMSLPNIYRATATVLVERQQVPESFVQPTVTSGLDSRLQMITRQVLSRSRLETLIRRFDLYPDLRQRLPLGEIIVRMQQDISLEPQEVRQSRRGGGTTIAFTLGFRGRDPRKVAEVTNMLASFYIEENLKVREQQATGTSRFLKAQLLDIRQRLEDQEQKLGQFKEQYIGELPEQLNANLATLERLNVQLRLNNDKQARTSERRASIKRELAEQEAATAFQPDKEPPEVRLSRLQGELAALRTRFSDKYPDVVRLKGEITGLKGHLAATAEATEPQKNVLPPSGQRLQEEYRTVIGELKALRSEEQHLVKSIAVHQQRVENTPRREQELQTLSRDYETTQELYRSLLKRQEEARMAENMEQRQKGEHFQLLEPAMPPTQPEVPNRLRLLLLGFLGAIGVAAAVVALVEQLDTSFHTAEELRSFTKYPVLVSLPRIVTQSDIRRHRWRFGLATATVVLCIGLVAGSVYVFATDNTQWVAFMSQSRLLRR